jgi:CHAD domain-containing protein
VQHYLLLRRSESYSRALRKLGKINPAVLYVNLKAVLTQDGSHPHPNGHHHHAPASERPAFSRSLIHELDTVWSEFEEQLGQSHHDAQPRVIHAARIATKRLRYLLEVFHEFKVAGSAEGLAWLRQLQQQLGDWHDLEVLEQSMIEMLARPEFLREQLGLAMEVSKLIFANRKAKAGLEVRYVQMSRESAELRRLKDWVTYVAASPSEALATASAAG